MKLHNISDVATTRLSSVGLVNATAKVGGKFIKPGESETFRYMPPDAARLIRMGVLAAGEKPPADYLKAKGQAEVKQGPTPEPSPMPVEVAAPEPVMEEAVAPEAPSSHSFRRSRRSHSDE